MNLYVIAIEQLPLKSKQIRMHIRMQRGITNNAQRLLVVYPKLLALTILLDCHYKYVLKL
jgi:hypothetical protein